MPTEQDISAKRQLLLDFRMRFAPETQQSRENLIDSFIKHALFTPDSVIGLSNSEIQSSLHDNLKINVDRQEIFSSLKRLIKDGAIEEQEEGLEGIRLIGRKKKFFYRLLSSTRELMEKQEKESWEKFNIVCKRLFKDAQEGWEAFAEPLVQFLSLVFSRLAGENYRMIHGEYDHVNIKKMTVFSIALDTIKKKYRTLNLTTFEQAAETFFRDPDPDFATIKWNMAQSYYALRVIGLAKYSTITSDVFSNALFYLDTNVVISALEPNESHHKAFLSLYNVCDRLGITVKVSDITLGELKRVIDTHRKMLEQAIDQIPEGTGYKISSDFYEAYVEKKASGEMTDIGEIFSNYESAGDKLKQNYKVKTENIQWLRQIENDEKTKMFTNIIFEQYLKTRRRRKGNLAAKHDALSLLWIEELRAREKGNNIWFVTRDYSLPLCIPPKCDHTSLAITLDALIQWIAPVVESSEEEQDIAVAYSNIISSRILPQERIFDLEDFIIFHELEMECNSLPPEDVEGCIRQIKQNVPYLNPNEPGDREKLARVIAIYFADPSRKYKENLNKYESAISTLKGEIKKQTIISIRKDAWLRLSHIVITFILMEILVFVLAINFGSGENNFQKIVGSWPFILIPISICTLAGWFYLGEQRLKALGWSTRKLFR